MFPTHDPARPHQKLRNPGMTEKDEILAALRAALPEMKRCWPIRSLAVFGSVARGEASAASDLDVLVEFARLVGLSEFLALEDALSALVGRRVDLVTRRALKPYIGRHVLDEAVLL
jgi:predicted nucleotidyltransferase